MTNLTQQRPLSHLDLETVLVSAWLYEWRAMPEGDVAVLLKSVKLLDYETGKKQLALTQDHCWLWIAENYWKSTWGVAIATGEQMTRHDEVWLCCTVGPYRRNDGSSDWGLRPRNQFPVAPKQSRELQKWNTNLWRNAQKVKGHKLVEKWVAQSVYQAELEHRAADWRELGRSYKDACTNVKRNLKALEHLLTASGSSVDEAMLEQGAYSGHQAIQQLRQRVTDAER